MKKKIFSFVLLLCLIVPAMFCLAGCGEEFIVEGEYKLINAQVIRDNSYLYQPDSDGEFVTYIVGGMTLDKCVVNVGKQKSQLIFTDTNSKMVATFNFVRYNDKSQYPAFKCDNVKILINGVDVKTFTEEEKTTFNNDYSNLLAEVSHVADNFLANQTSLQLATFNQTFTCHLIIKNANNELLLMATVYGY